MDTFRGVWLLSFLFLAVYNACAENFILSIIFAAVSSLVFTADICKMIKS